MTTVGSTPGPHPDDGAEAHARHLADQLREHLRVDVSERTVRALRLYLSRVGPSMRSRALRVLLGAYLALMTAYGLGNMANDFWTEQIWKRGWTDWEIPDVTRPQVSVAWGVVVLGAAVLYLIANRRARRAPTASTPLRGSA